MADFVNPSTRELLASANSMPSPWIVCTRANLISWSAIETKYRKWVTDHVEEMSAGEKVTTDAAIETARQAGELAQYDAKTLFRALVLALLDEINTVRQWDASFKVEVAAATTLADLKTRVASLPAMPDRTAAQARTAIINKLATLNGA